MTSTTTTTIRPIDQLGMQSGQAKLDRQSLLNSRQMATFVSDGFLRFDEMVPRDLCEEFIAELDAGIYPNYAMPCKQPWGIPFADVWPNSLAAGRIFALPAVRAIIESLVGPNCRFDHYGIHKIDGHTEDVQLLHQDAEIDPRSLAFDIQISLFPHDVPKEMGGTLFVPGSHFRRVHLSEIGRYQNIVGQVQTVCPAGTLVVWHHNLWHGGRSNHTARPRYMFKLRLNPMVRQQRLWNTDDLDHPEINHILCRVKPWHGARDRVEHINRMQLWRFLTGDAISDESFYLKRVENEPTSTYVPK